MAVARSWRSLPPVEGPFPARVEEIPALNVVFSDAFTERYRRDGMVGVRVPNLNPQVWRYAIEDSADGAMVWRDARGEIAAFTGLAEVDFISLADLSLDGVGMVAVLAASDFMSDDVAGAGVEACG